MARTPGALGKKSAINNGAPAHNAQDTYIKQLEDRLAFYEAKKIDSGDEDDIFIGQTEYIKVMSLLPYRLNLCTKERGQGKVYKFDKLYQVKKIIYSDLVDILEVAHEFLESGYFIILNPKVIRAHGLDDIYEKVLDKDRIEEIFTGTDEGVALFISATSGQKNVICDLVVQRLVQDDKSIDLNLVDKLSRLSGVNLSQKAEETRELMKPASIETEKE
jgi:hypothetical protein